MYIDEVHESWLPEEYFSLVARISRFPRYVNKRILDPQLKCFVDECGIEIPPEWGIPVPNAAASYKSLAKYGKSILPMTPLMVARMNKAWVFTAQHFGLYMRDSKVISYAEAKEHLDMSTSSGAPFNVHYKTKKDLFEKDPEIDGWLEMDWERMANDPKWSCLFTNSLKEELRTSEKLAENSQRTFLAGGTDAVVHGTRLFVDMNEKMYESHLLTASAVGMSPYKGNWDRLYQKLRVFRKGYALDESQYDSSLRTFLMWGCARFRWEMLREEDRTKENLARILVYYRNLVNTLVICPDGVIVMKKTGNPSGSVNTITDNTLILYTLLAYAWLMVAPESFSTYEQFELHTAKALVGDDNTWTVSDEAHEFFNATSVIEQWKEIGVTTTTDSLEPRKPEELDFLSAHTVFLNGKAVPIYNRVKLMTSLLFAPRDHMTPSTTLERTAAMLGVGWTDIPFRKFCRDVIEWLIWKYDPVLCDEPRWILAKCQIQLDERYYMLFTGEKRLILPPQGLFGGTVKLTQPDKIEMNTQVRKANGTKPGKKTRQQRPRRPIVVAVRAKRKAPQRRRARRRMNNRRVISPTGVGGTRTGLRSKKSCPVEEDEFIANIAGSTGFAVTQFSINPGQAATFPWLSLQAKQWEKYHFEYLEFYYKRMVSEFATNGTTGKVMMSIDFDASDPPPTSKQQIEDSDPRVDGMPCENIRLPLTARELHPLAPTLFVRPGGVPGSSDIKTFDAGKLNIATQDNQNTSNVGELRVRYKVIFSVPVLDSTTSAPANNSVAVFASTTGTVGTLVTTVLTPLPVATVIINGISAVNTAGSIVLPAGNYFVDFDAEVIFSGLSTIMEAQINKDTVAINGTQISSGQWVAGQITDHCLHVSGYFSSNGTNVLQAVISATFSTGTALPGGTLRIIAV